MWFNLPLGFDVYLLLKQWNIKSNYLVFSENLNFIMNWYWQQMKALDDVTLIRGMQKEETSMSNLWHDDYCLCVAFPWCGPPNSLFPVLQNVLQPKENYDKVFVCFWWLWKRFHSTVSETLKKMDSMRCTCLKFS